MKASTRFTDYLSRPSARAMDRTNKKDPIHNKLLKRKTLIM